MPAPAAVTNVALLFEANNAYARGLLVGIGDYILSHGPWSVHYAEPGPADAPPPWLRTWDGHGLIVRGKIRRLKCPANGRPHRPEADVRYPTHRPRMCCRTYP